MEEPAGLREGMFTRIGGRLLTEQIEGKGRKCIPEPELRWSIRLSVQNIQGPSLPLARGLRLHCPEGGRPGALPQTRHPFRLSHQGFPVTKAIGSHRHTVPVGLTPTLNYTVISMPFTHPPNRICGWLASCVTPNTSGIKSPLKLRRKHEAAILSNSLAWL